MTDSSSGQGKGMSGSQGIKIKELLSQWQRERPDLDAEPMAVCGELWRASERVRKAVVENAAQSQLDLPGLDVLLTLRRQGKGESLSPSQLSSEMMLSTSAMTNRLDRLEKAGLIVRKADAQDRRALQILLTKQGFKVADTLVESHVRTEAALIANLSKRERKLLCELLARVGR